MNKDYKQYKKILASVPFLVGLSVICVPLIYVFVTYTSNSLITMIQYLAEGLRASKETFQFPPFPNLFERRFFFTPQLIASYKLVHLFIWFGVLVYAFVRFGFFIYKLRRSYDSINRGSKGTQELTKMDEISKQYRKVKMDDNEYEGLSGIPVVMHDDYVYMDDANTNSETIGSTQSGKTQGFTYPTMDLGMRAKIKDTFIISDVKGNMVRNTMAEWKKWGYDVYCLNLIDPDNSMSYNPLELIKQAYVAKDFGKAQLLAQTFSFSVYNEPNAKDKFWQDTSIALLNALILAVCDIAIKEKKMHYVTLYSVVTMLITLSSNPDDKGKTDLDIYFENLPPTNPARMQFSMIEKATGVTRSGIYTSMQSKLAPFMNDKIARLTAQNTLNLEDLGYGEKPIALFLVVPDFDESNYSLVTTFLTQANYVLAEKATSSASGKLKRRVRKLLEEIANFPAIDGLSRGMNVDLERGILTHLVVQSEAQLVDKYTEPVSKAITGACGNKIYIMSDEIDDAEKFSRFLGDKTIIGLNRHGDPLSLDKSYGEQEDGRRLLDENEMRSLKEGEWVFIRTKKRKDLKGNHISAKPIFANREEGTNIKFAYEYLDKRFKSDKMLSEYDFGGTHAKLDLSTLVINFKGEMVDIPVYDEQADTYSNDHSENEPANYFQVPLEVSHKEGVQAMAEAIDPLSQTDTLLEKELSSQKLQIIHQLMVKNLTEEEYQHFASLTTVEEVKSFLSTPTRLTLKTQVQTFVFN